VSRPALGFTQPPVQWVPGGPFPGIKALPGRDADHSPPSTAEVENESELYLLYPLAPSWLVVRQLLKWGLEIFSSLLLIIVMYIIIIIIIIVKIVTGKERRE
jgi:hypothetical protein